MFISVIRVHSTDFGEELILIVCHNFTINFYCACDSLCDGACDMTDVCDMTHV